MSKPRAYIEDRDRAVIKKWAPIKPDIPFIVKKVNDERMGRGLPTFIYKHIKAELQRGTPEGKTIREYDPKLAKKCYKMGKNKNLPFFDVRSIIVLRWFIVRCKMDAKNAYIEYKRLYSRETCDILKLHSVFDVEWLIRYGYAKVNDVQLFNRIQLTQLELRGRVPHSEMAISVVEEYLRRNPDEGKYALYGELPLGYKRVDEVTQEPLNQEQIAADESRRNPEETKQIEIPKKEDIEICEKDDVSTFNLPAGGRLLIVNTSPNVDYQLTRKGNDYIIIL